MPEDTTTPREARPIQRPPALPLRRKLLFAFILVVVLPALLLLALEVVVRIVDPDVRDDPYLAFTTPLSVLSKTEIDGRAYYEISNPEVYRAQNQTFPVEKPPDTVRIFGLGGSAAAGWPHPQDESYTAYLQAMLALALPDKSIEVHNVAGHGFASYRVRMIFDEIIECDPDLVIIYSGNNEFVEDRTYAEGGLRGVVRGLAARSRLAQVVQGWARSLLPPATTLPGNEKGQVAWHVWGNLQRIAHQLRSDPGQFEQLQEHYAYSMDTMARRARDHGVPILFVTVPTNLRDWHPHVSSHSLPEAERAAWQQAFAGGRRLLLDGVPEAARAALEQVVQLDPVAADPWFYLGRACGELGLRGEALAAYRAAKDEDRNPFRALSAFNETLRGLPAAHEGTHTLDVERIFEDAAEGGVPGFDLFLDYVHPSKRGNQLLARSLLQWILENSVGGVPPGEAETRYRAAVDGYTETPYRDDADLMMQWMRMQLAVTMHQYETYVGLADVLLPRAEAKEVAIDPGLIRRFRDQLATYLDEQRRELCGEPFDPDYRAAHERFYKEAFLGAFGTKAADRAGGDETGK